jgi:hypothetical protein
MYLLFCHLCYKHGDVDTHTCPGLQHYHGNKTYLQELMQVTRYLQMRPDELCDTHSIFFGERDRVGRLKRVYLSSSNRVKDYLRFIEIRNYNLQQDYFLQQAYQELLHHFYRPGTGMQIGKEHFYALCDLKAQFDCL